MSNRQTGFTIIELIVVIALLGILSAVALPRFINVTDKAHVAAVEGAGAGFATGLALLKAQVIANGTLGTQTNNVAGYGDDTLDVNTNGYAIGTDDGATLSTDSDCVGLWQGLFDANGPSVIASGSTGSDFVASLNAGVCTYTYKTQGSGTRKIDYTASTGAASVTAS